MYDFIISITCRWINCWVAMEAHVSVRSTIWIASLLLLSLCCFTLLSASAVALKAIIVGAALLSLLGLSRRLNWGRILAMILLAYMAMIWFGLWLPISGRPDDHWLELLIGYTPSLSFFWVALMLGDAALLGCAYMLSKHKSVFQRGVW